MNPRMKEKANNNNFANKKRKYHVMPKNIQQVLVKKIDYNSVVTSDKIEEITPQQRKIIKKSFYNLSGDTNFKLVMGDPNFLADFLSSYYNKKINPEDIRYNTIEETSIGGKTIRADLLVVFKMNGRKHKIFLNLEMQNKYDKELKDRMFKYLIVIKSLNMKPGDNYRSDVYEGIWFMPTSVASNFIKDNSYITRYTMKSDKGYKLTNDKISVIDLHKMSRCDIKELEDIAKLFIAKSTKEIDNMQTDIGKKWRDKLMLLNTDFLAKYNMFLQYSHEDEEKSYARTRYKEIRTKARAEGRAEGRVEGISKGIVRGLAEGKIAVAKNMLSEGCNLDLIAKCTGLTYKEIKRLK